MWSGKTGVEGGRLAIACRAMCKIMAELGIAVDGGKDSLSMSAGVKGTRGKKKYICYVKFWLLLIYSYLLFYTSSVSWYTCYFYICSVSKYHSEIATMFENGQFSFALGACESREIQVIHIYC